VLYLPRVGQVVIAEDDALHARVEFRRELRLLRWLSWPLAVAVGAAIVTWAREVLLSLP
jgi:hypothetical protein